MYPKLSTVETRRSSPVTTPTPPFIDVSYPPKWHRWCLLVSILLVYGGIQTVTHTANRLRRPAQVKNAISSINRSKITNTTKDHQREDSSTPVIHAEPDTVIPNAVVPGDTTFAASPETVSNSQVPDTVTDKGALSAQNDTTVPPSEEVPGALPNKTLNVVLAKTTDKVHGLSKNKTDTVPQVIWLMSFPNSGTTYTNKLVQGISQTTTATNYGQEQLGYKTSIPITPDLPDGPYYRYPDWNHSNSVLTKTHCGGYCIRCEPKRYVLKNAEEFESFCRSGNKMVNGKELLTKKAYSPNLPKKAVHIIRNPFDNIVARLHMQRKNWANRNDREDYLKLFTDSPKGFRKWCAYLDYTAFESVYNSKLFDNTTKDLFQVIPCAEDFYRYVQWHNFAVEMAQNRLKLPTHRIFYKNYTESFDETIHQLLDFLELPAVSKPPHFIEGKEYPDYFTKDEKYFVGQLVRHLATNETWTLLSHYFDGLMDVDE